MRHIPSTKCVADTTGVSPKVKLNCHNVVRNWPTRLFACQNVSQCAKCIRAQTIKKLKKKEVKDQESIQSSITPDQ